MYRQASTRVSPVHQYQARLWFHTRKKKEFCRREKKSSPENFYPRFTHGKQFFDKKTTKKPTKIILKKNDQTKQKSLSG